MLPAYPLPADLATTAQQLGLTLPAALLPATRLTCGGGYTCRLDRFDGDAAAAGPLQPTFPYQDLRTPPGCATS